MDISSEDETVSAERIRVLHVAEPAGGVDRYLRTLFRYTDNERIENILVCSQHYAPRDYEGLCDAVENVDMAHEISPADDMRSVAAIRKLIHKYSPDIVYAHSSKSGALLRMADMGISNKVIYNPHGWAFEMDVPDKKKKMYRQIERMQTPFTDRVICISRSERRAALREKICTEYKLSVIWNGIDTDEVKKAVPVSREALGIPEDIPVIGMAGRLVEQKAPDVFTRACALIKRKIPSAYFLIVGGGRLRPQISDMIIRLGLTDCCQITGWVDNPYSYMKIFDVGVLLSRWEGFGLAVPEMMYCGVPVVSSSVGGLREIITDGRNGLLVPPDDPEKAADAVIRILDDQALMDHLRTNGRRTVLRRYDGRRMAEEMEKIYREVLC